MTPQHILAIHRLYDQLPDIDRFILEFVAFCDQPTSRLRLLQELVAILPTVLSDATLSQKEVAPRYRALREQDLLIEVYHGITVPEVVGERALRDALISERCHTYLLSPLAHERAHFRKYGIHQLRSLQRHIREALYRNSRIEMLHSYDLYLKETETYRFEDNQPLAEIMAVSTDFSFLCSGPRDFYLKYLPPSLEVTQHHHRQGVSFIEPLAEFIDKCIPLSEIKDNDERSSALELMLLWVGECWLCGEVQNTAYVIAEMTGHQKIAARAVVAFQENDIETALGLFNDALRQMRKVTVVANKALQSLKQDASF